MRDCLIDESEAVKREIILALDQERARQRLTMTGLCIECGLTSSCWHAYVNPRYSNSPKLGSLIRVLRVLGLRLTITDRRGRTLAAFDGTT